MQKLMTPDRQASTLRLLEGKAAIVTGSTSGIGLGIAHALAAAGANVMLNGFGDSAEVAAVQRDLEQDHGVATRYSVADMSKPADIARMFEDAVTAFGQVDILVNNAGIQHVEAIETF